MASVQLVCFANSSQGGERGDVLAIHDGGIDLSTYASNTDLWVVTVPGLTVAEARANLQPVEYEEREVYRTAGGWQEGKPSSRADELESQPEWKHGTTWKKHGRGIKGTGRSLSNLTTGQMKTLEGATATAKDKTDALKAAECVMARRPENQDPTPVITVRP